MGRRESQECFGDGYCSNLGRGNASRLYWTLHFIFSFLVRLGVEARPLSETAMWCTMKPVFMAVDSGTVRFLCPHDKQITTNIERTQGLGQ